MKQVTSKFKNVVIFSKVLFPFPPRCALRCILVLLCFHFTWQNNLLYLRCCYCWQWCWRCTTETLVTPQEPVASHQVNTRICTCAVFWGHTKIFIYDLSSMLPSTDFYWLTNKFHSPHNGNRPHHHHLQTSI